MATKKKLPPIPRPRKTRRQEEGAAQGADAAPNLSHIPEGLRGLAWPVDRLQFHPENPRVHPTEHIDELAASLRVSGQYKNLVASTRTEPPVVVCGNGTLQAALRLGWTHLAVDRKPMTLAEEHRHLIIDNLTGANPTWEDARLLRLARDLDTNNDPKMDAMVSELLEAEGLIPKDSGDKDTSTGGNTNAPAASSAVTCPACGHEFSRV